MVVILRRARAADLSLIVSSGMAFAVAVRMLQIGLVLLTASVATASPEKAQLARLMWSAFKCGTYAEISGQRDDQVRFFQLALKAGREFIDALKAKEITEQEYQDNVPLSITPSLRGGDSNTDVVLGRIFQSITNEAFEDVAGLENDLMDDRAKRRKAQTKYLEANCAVIHTD